MPNMTERTQEAAPATEAPPLSVADLDLLDALAGASAAEQALRRLPEGHVAREQIEQAKALVDAICDVGLEGGTDAPLGGRDGEAG